MYVTYCMPALLHLNQAMRRGTKLLCINWKKPSQRSKGRTERSLTASIPLLTTGGCGRAYSTSQTSERACRMTSTPSTPASRSLATPQRGIAPILYTLFTHDCVASHKVNTILKFADDTTVIGASLVETRQPTGRRWPVWCHGVRTTTPPSKWTRRRR